MGLAPTQKSVMGTFINGRNALDDFLQFSDNHGGTVFGWIDSNGLLQGTLRSAALTWDQIGAAAAPLVLANANFASTFNQTSAVAWTLANTTPATSIAPQSSPILTLTGQGWNGAASITSSVTFQASTATQDGGAQLIIGSSGGPFHGLQMPGVLNAGSLLAGSVTSTSGTLTGISSGLTSAANASGGNTTYQGNFTASAMLAGMTVTIAGFVTGANNGTFVVQSGNSAQVVVNNPSGVSETHAGTCTVANSYGGTGTIVFSGQGLGTITIQGVSTSVVSAFGSNIQSVPVAISAAGDPNDAGFVRCFALANTDHGFQIGAIYDGTGANPGFLKWGIIGGSHALQVLMPDGLTGVVGGGNGFTAGTSVGSIKIAASNGDGSTANSLVITGAAAAVFNCGVTGKTLTINTATPTGAAGTISFGTTTATSATAGSNGAVPAQVLGYLQIDIAGTKVKIPYFNN